MLSSTQENIGDGKEIKERAMIGDKHNLAFRAESFEVLKPQKMNSPTDEYPDKQAHKGKIPQCANTFKVTINKICDAKCNSLFG